MNGNHYRKLLWTDIKAKIARHRCHVETEIFPSKLNPINLTWL